MYSEESLNIKEIEMEIIIGLLIVCGLGYYLFRKSSQAKDVVESAAPVVSAPYKVPEPALATIIPLVTTPAPVVAKPVAAKKPRAKKPVQHVAQASKAPAKPAAMKAPAKAKPKTPAKPKAK